MTKLAVQKPSIPAPFTWQQQLQQAITSLDELCRVLDLDIDQVKTCSYEAKAFALKVPRAFVAKMAHGDPADPLLAQVLPSDLEALPFLGFEEDPLAERSVNPVQGLLHKYAGRVLLVVTGSCSVHCRYCFRRHFPYDENNPGQLGWQKAIDYIAQDDSIREVIFSGGDPLLASDKLLAHLAGRVEAISHVKQLRIHTRLPVTIPDRITPGFTEWFTNSRLKPVLVLHANHANEIDDTVKAALAPLRARGVTLLNQAVLLKNINDSVQTQVDLSNALFDAGVLPYYIHILDKVKGAGHFDVDAVRAKAITSGMRDFLPGYLVPTLVKEVPGGKSKTPL